ncbi:hypothetical protein STEG23_037784, partial [Scotinomys teguina]
VSSIAVGKGEPDVVWDDLVVVTWRGDPFVSTWVLEGGGWLSDWAPCPRCACPHQTDWKERLLHEEGESQK